MDNDFFKKFLNMDEIILLRHLDNAYVIGLGLIVIRFLICLGEDFFCGEFIFPIFKEGFYSILLFLMWRTFCEILYCVAPKDKKHNQENEE